MDAATITQIVIAAFTGVYVVLTLVIVLITGRSFKVTRDALTANDKQSKAALDAVRDQIVASEKQAQEALYNQHKPIIVPIGGLNSNDATIWSMQIENWGAGVAFNTWGIITMKGTPIPNIPLSPALPFRYFFTETHILIPNKPNGVSFRIGEPQVPFRQQILFTDNMFEGISIYPLQDEKSNSFATSRLMMTYNDVFSNNHMVVFDYNESFGWRQVGEIKRVSKRLDERVVRKDNGLSSS